MVTNLRKTLVNLLRAATASAALMLPNASFGNVQKPTTTQNVYIPLPSETQEGLQHIDEAENICLNTPQREKLYTEARQILETAYAKNPLDADALRGIGIIDTKYKKYSTAMQRLKQSEKIRETPAVLEALTDLYIDMRDFSRAEESAHGFMEQNPAKAYKKLAFISFEKKDYKTALSRWLEALRLNPDDAAVLSDIGSTCRELGNLKSAEKYLEQSIRLRSCYPNAHYNLGLVYEKENRITEAKKEITEALELEPQAKNYWRKLQSLK